MSDQFHAMRSLESGGRDDYEVDDFKELNREFDENAPESDMCPKCGHYDLAPSDGRPGECWRACNGCDHQWNAAIPIDTNTEDE